LTPSYNRVKIVSSFYFALVKIVRISDYTQLKQTSMQSANPLESEITFARRSYSSKISPSHKGILVRQRTVRYVPVHRLISPALRIPLYFYTESPQSSMPP
jgi:hypothetical protein